MMPAGRQPPEDPLSEEKPSSQTPWQSPWSLEEDLNHWPVLRPERRWRRPEPETGNARFPRKAGPAGSAPANTPSTENGHGNHHGGQANGNGNTQRVAKPASLVVSPKSAPKPLHTAAGAPIPTPAPAPAKEKAKAQPQPLPPPPSQDPPTANVNPVARRLATPSGKGYPPDQLRPRTSWFGAIVLSLGLLGMTFLAWIYMQDSPPASDEDLRISLPVDQTPAITAPRRLLSFLDSVARLENRSLGQKTPSQWDTPALAQFVAANGVAYDNLRDLLEDAAWHPRHAAWHGTDLGVHPAWQDVSILLQAQAAYLMRRGDEEGAFTTAMDLAELGRRLQELWTWPSFQARSQELHTAAVQSMAELLQQTQLPSARLLAFQEEFTRCNPSDVVLQEALNAFYVHEKKMLLGASSGEPLDTMPGGVTQGRPGRLFFKVNQTLALFAGAFRELKTEVAAPPYATFSVTGERLRHSRQSAPQFYQPNGTGEKYFSDRIDPYLRLPEIHSLARARHGLVLNLFAIRRYAADHQQRLPGSLEELKPAYVAELPPDPFSGEPFHYDPKKGLLFSVGTNLITEGGKATQPPLADDREPTVQIGLRNK